MYNPRLVVGEFFEKRLMNLFSLVRTDSEHSHELPDLKSKDGSFYVEVKASGGNNGGVVKREQLFRFDKDINVRRFYAFVYHSLGRDIERDYPNEKVLRCALDLKSLYLFPFSIAKAYYENSNHIRYLNRDFFVLVKERTAEKIFNFDGEVWNNLRLDRNGYKTIKPNVKMNIMTKEGNLEDKIIKSVNPKYI